jgi:[ribosomal protein S5]-alanine N-acetyltransferase
MSSPIHIETTRLIIRDHIKEDFESHHKLFSDEKAMYYLPEIMTRSHAASLSNLQATIDDIHEPNRTKYFLRIESKLTKEHIGEIGYTVTDFTPLGKLVLLGYFIYPFHWNKGFTTEAAAALIHYAFDENDVYRITTGCLKENIGSERVMQKCKMIKEADLKHSVWHDGKMKDRVSYRLLREEWLLSSPIGI